MEKKVNKFQSLIYRIGRSLLANVSKLITPSPEQHNCGKHDTIKYSLHERMR